MYSSNIKDIETSLHSYYDIDFIGDKLLRKSILGNLYFFRGGVVLCLLKR